MLQVCNAVREKVTVLLTGDGGDDVFLGYSHHRTLWMAEKIGRWLPPGVASAWHLLQPLAMRSPVLRRPWRIIDYASGGLGAVTRANDGLPWFGAAGYLGERLLSVPLPDRQIPRSCRSGRAVLRDFLEYERNTRFVSEYMTKVDGGAMHYGIEARSPFLDQRMWEFAAGLPFDVRLRGGELKAVLRELVRRHVGVPVAARRKQGFTIPVERWMLTKWGPQLEEIASESLLEQNGWLRRGALRRALADAKRRRVAPVQLWSVLVLERWMQHDEGRAAHFSAADIRSGAA
jgi:asparagine synthase (glutamine-hydrolysing)